MKIYAWFLILWYSFWTGARVYRGEAEAVFWALFVAIPLISFCVLYLNDKANLLFAYLLIAVWIISVLGSLFGVTGSQSPMVAAGEVAGSLLWGLFPAFFVYFTKTSSLKGTR